MRNIDIHGPLVCQQHDPEIWHEEETEQQAVLLCTTGDPGGRPCPLLAACLDYSTDPANGNFTRHGVWGGVNAHKRDRIRARRARGQADRYASVTFTTTNRRTSVQEFSS